MTYQRLPYDDASTATEMTSDCRAVESALRLPGRRTPAERARAAALRPAPSIRFEDFPREVRKPTIRVSEAASRLAAAIHPYLD
jgi:hypothetical protein